MEPDREKLSDPKTRVEVIYAGGTISSLATPAGYREGGHVVDLVERLEEVQPGFTKRFDIGQPQVAYTGLSENIEQPDLDSIEDSINIALTRNPDSVVISFGTDFAEQAAKRFQKKYKEQLLQKKIKIIIVCANDDIAHPKTDAWDNLTFTFNSTEQDVEPGVYMGFHQRLIPAVLVAKEPYNGVEMNFRSTDDPEYIAATQNRQEQNDRQIAQLRPTFERSSESIEGEVLDYPVNIFRLNHDEFLEQIRTTRPKAVLLTLYHSGTANTTESDASVAKLVNALRAQGIVCFGVTENGEPVDLHSYETSVKLREAGVVPLYDMQKDVALAKLQSLATGSPVEIIDQMLKNRIGEITENKIITDDINELRQFYSGTS